MSSCQPFNVRLGSILGVLTISMFVSVLYLDRYSSGLLNYFEIPGDLREVIEYISIFGHGFGWMVAVLLIWQLDPKNRNTIRLILATELATGIVTTALKVAFHRVRPIATGELSNVDSTAKCNAET